MRLIKLLPILFFLSCAKTIPLKWDMPPTWEVSDCKATYLKREEKVNNNQLIVRYTYPVLGVPDQVRCMVSGNFGSRFLNTSLRGVNLMFMNDTTKEALLYSFTRPSETDLNATLTVLVVSKVSEDKFTFRELEYKGPLNVFIDRFDFGSVYIEYKYKTIDNEREVEASLVPVLYRLMWR